MNVTPNLLTALRLASLPVLWALAVGGNAFWVGVLLAAAWLTDILDGLLARRLDATTPLGSRLDTLADHLLFGSMLAWVVLLRPGFLREQAMLLLVWGILWLGALGVGWIRFRRFADLHLYSSKAATVAAALFVIHLFLAAEYSRPVFYAAIGVCSAAALEMLLVLATRDRVDERIGTIFKDP